MMQNLSIIEAENEVLRSRYANLKKAARGLALEVERNCAPSKNRETMFALVEAIKTMTKK